jgi:NAD(P)-dependent dehydrogenase (short-subunit alcohol dehydrogenase family)
MLNVANVNEKVSQPPDDVAGRTALVTGGGSGIGRAVAVELARRGMDVLIVGRRREALAATAEAHPAIGYQVGNVSAPADITEMVAAARELGRPGRIDVLVNNAGIGRPAPLGEIEPDMAQRLWATNVLGPTMLAQQALPFLLESRGTVINISSTFGAKPAPGISMYGATKAALEQLTRSWALELAPRGVRVNAVAPGPVQSEALERMGLSPAEIAQVKATEQDRIPLGRRGRPEEVARWVAHLADPAIWVTGQVIGVDGGYLVA